MFRAAWKSLLARKVRLVMSTFAIVLGVAFVGGSLVFSDTLQRSFTALFASTVGDVVVSPRSTTDQTQTTLVVPASLQQTLEQVPGAARVDGQVIAQGVYVVDTHGKLVGGSGPPGLGGNWSDAPAGHGLPGMSITQGHEPHGPDEVVLDATTADKAGYAVGDRISLLTAGDRAQLHPELVGIADFEHGGSLNGATLAMFDTRTSQRLFLGGRDAYSTYWVTARDGVSQTELRDQVRRVLPDRYKALTGDDAADASASDLLDAISFIRTFLLIFAGIALVVGAFLIVNTFSILVAQRTRELALLRALGASRRQVSRSVLFEAFVLGVLGSSLGLGLGVLLAMAIRALFASFGLDLSGQPLVFAGRTVLAAYAVGVVVTMAAAWLPARRTGRIAPVQALRDDIALPESAIWRRLVIGLVLIAAGAVAMGLGLFTDVPQDGWFVGLGVLAVLLGVSSAAPVIARPFLAAARVVYARVFGAVGTLAGQNSSRNPRRTTATASALMIGLALACTMAIVGDSAKASVDQQIEESFVGDYVVSSAFGQPFSPRIGDRMARVDGVTEVVRQRYAPAMVGGDQQFLAGVNPEAIDGLDLRMTRGSTAGLTDQTVLVNAGWAHDHHRSVGDRLTVGVPTGTVSLRIAGTFDDTPTFFAPILATDAALEHAGYPKQDNQLIIMATDRPGLRAALDHVVADLPVVTVNDEAGYAAEQRKPIDQMVLMIFALLGLALVIAVLGIVNTLALSIIERTREVGLLRAIGLGRGQLRRMITLESVVIALLGALLGVLLGIGFGVALMYALRDQGLDVISVPWTQVVVFLVLSVLIGVLAAVFPARRAGRLDVLRAIATE